MARAVEADMINTNFFPDFYTIYLRWNKNHSFTDGMATLHRSRRHNLQRGLKEFWAIYPAKPP